MSHPGKLYEKIKKLVLEKREGLLVIKINNPLKKNCLNRDLYVEIYETLKIAAKDESVLVVAITGVGDFFTAGNDITIGTDVVNLEKLFKESNVILQNLIRSFFEFPKLLIAVVNGPCIGIGMTIAALCDIIYCTDTTYFYTPFTKLGLCPEGCSSYTFPKIFGKSKATEILLLNKKLTAEEALQYKFVAEVVKPNELDTKIWPKILEFTRLCPGSIRTGKYLMMKALNKELETAMTNECMELSKRLVSDDFFNAVVEFGKSKSKL